MSNIKDSQLKYLDGLMRTDVTLLSLVSNPMRIYPIQGMKDPAFPYIVHDISSVESEFIGISQGLYTVNIWYANSKPSGIWAIKDRIITLVDYRSFTAVDGSGNNDVYACRTWLQGEEDVVEPMEDIWHYVLVFYLRYDRFRDISNIVSR